uniref:Putative secreted protein n=1 Tax=Ixodes ricinus TaxID=34613 RepID=A0A6B0UD26_IXORI
MLGARWRVHVSSIPWLQLCMSTDIYKWWDPIQNYSEQNSKKWHSLRKVGWDLFKRTMRRRMQREVCERLKGRRSPSPEL